MKEKETIRTKIWEEEPESDNPFSAKACYCHGYDVYGELLGNITWIQYLFLLFQGERPTSEQARLLESLAIAIANPGPRDYSVRAAMDSGVGGSHNAASLIAALAVGAGQYGGAREIYNAMKNWADCRTDINKWEFRIQNPFGDERADVWAAIEHPPGFDPYGESCSTLVLQTLNYFSKHSNGAALLWLNDNRSRLENISDCPLAMTGVTAAAFYDLGFTCDQGEMLYLLLRLPGAAVHSMEQNKFGFKDYPFFHDSIHLTDDPAKS